MEKVVVDTSVIVKWFIEEPKSKEALELLDLHKKNKISLLVPEIIIVELLNALYYSNNYNVKELKLALTLFRKYKLIEIKIDDSSLFETASIMHKYHITSYDALYISLAKELDCKLITNDRKHHLQKIYKKIVYL